jgi:hypothetical protein
MGERRRTRSNHRIRRAARRAPSYARFFGCTGGRMESKSVSVDTSGIRVRADLLKQISNVSPRTRDLSRIRAAAVRESCVLKQSLASCDHCGRRLHTLARRRQGRQIGA